MHTFIVRFRWEGITQEEEVTTYTAGQARSIIQSRFPGCSIQSVKQMD